MKVALPTRNGNIDAHFGHCEYYTVLTVDDVNKEILNCETVESPQGCGCKSNIAQVLAKMGVDLMLAGNMGDGAVNVLHNSGIKVVRGCSGDVNSVALDYLNGKISDSGDSCHAHGHECHH
ncbi:MAG: NifB/NifX family molybdenum-iron cluster-binding protein [Tissierellia bacterium]|nr:NifB/NifX family molybdenum-iron cluster-binding protein [Tissierellia bacterium]